MTPDPQDRLEQHLTDALHADAAHAESICPRDLEALVAEGIARGRRRVRRRRAGIVTASVTGLVIAGLVPVFVLSHDAHREPPAATPHVTSPAGRRVVPLTPGHGGIRSAGTAG